MSLCRSKAECYGLNLNCPSQIHIFRVVIVAVVVVVVIFCGELNVGTSMF